MAETLHSFFSKISWQFAPPTCLECERLIRGFQSFFTEKVKVIVRTLISDSLFFSFMTIDIAFYLKEYNCSKIVLSILLSHGLPYLQCTTSVNSTSLHFFNNSANHKMPETRSIYKPLYLASELPPQPLYFAKK